MAWKNNQDPASKSFQMHFLKEKYFRISKCISFKKNNSEFKFEFCSLGLNR